ncbi:retrovirus-related pol polyprotein from transposon TNT 1-94 [Tanacetum coccineum]|uniref:Retrovirus-related pol polyprotein from transposon TNT 1-94 n=1 Tax=Tanacetum coccineum TaxID=301880 RepID=A0ABQ5IDD7_9ASTR
MSTIESAMPAPSTRESASLIKQNWLSTENDESLKSNIIKKNSSVQITRKPSSNTSVKNVKQTPILKLGQGLGESKIQTHTKTPHRRTSSLYPKSNFHQVGWNCSTQQGYQFQPPSFNPLGTCPPYQYMNQPNVKLEPDEWIKDSGCSRHMTGNKDLFSSYKAIDGDENGVISRNKARLVAQGYNQQEGIDFDETYAPVARLESIRILLAYACAHDFNLFQMDVKSDFLNGFINEKVYVAQPPSFIDFEKPNHVFKLKKALFGLKQAPKAWYDRLKAFLLDHIYIKEMLKKFGLEDSKPIKTPMSSKTKLTEDEDGESVDDTKYHGMIGSLLYLTASRPDIMFRVCLCARFQEVPKTSHLEVVKRIFRYTKGTSHLGLWYPKGKGVETIIYVDSDHAGDYIDRKSTSGVCTFMGCCLTSWFLKKQMALAISTTEAEYVSAGKACQQAL